LILRNVLCDFRVEFRDLTLCQGEACFDLAFQHLVGLRVAAVSQARPFLDRVNARYL
jgi:hypothetical protein